MFPPARRALVGALVFLPLAMSACVDAPSAPEGSAPGAFALSPVFSLVGPDGPAMTEGQENALSEAFDLVNRFRMVVQRASDKAVVLDTILGVTPGEDVYDLSVDIQAKENEQFLVTLTALQGEVELFTAKDIPAKATPVGVQGGPAPAPVQIPLVYSGPGATANAVRMSPTQAVLGPTGSTPLKATVLDAAGAEVTGVPLAWTTSAAGVATVSATGQVTGTGDGIATVTVTTPTGLLASALVYVVAGELAYVEGGVLKVRGAAGGTATERGTGASQPSWSADGGRLFYVSGGQVTQAGGGTLTAGGWPSLSPDGTKLAMERNGTVYFANDDGTGVRQGPAGTAPVWRSGSTVLVGGGSIQEVRADGEGRTTVVEGAATLPALAGDGRIASLTGGELRVTGVASALVSGAVGRPTWSPSGKWLVVGTGSGLVLVPSDGAGAAVPLPGLGSASDPAFKRTGSLAPSPAVNVTGFSPSPPLPGAQVQILGSGFDWILPGNNRVVWPTRDGTVEGEIRAVTETSLTTVMPRNVIAGQVAVHTRANSAALAFQPQFGGLDVTARTPWGAGVQGVGLSLVGQGATRTGSTVASGLAQFDGLIPGSYTLTISVPTGWTLSGDAVRALSIGGGVLDLALTLTPTVNLVALNPDPRAVAVGGTLGVTLAVTGPDGLVIPQVAGLTWRSGSPELTVTPGAGLTAVLGAVFAGASAGSSTLEVDVAGTTHKFPVSVTSRIEGLLTLDDGKPAPGVTVQVKRGGTLVGDAVTGSDGRYVVAGLFRGTYDVAPVRKDDLLPVPAGQTVTLDESNPFGKADFRMQSFATLEVSAKTPWDAPVKGVVLVLASGETEVAKATTDEKGLAELTRVAAGTYTLSIKTPDGFTLSGGASRAVTLLPGLQRLALELTPAVWEIKSIPAKLTVEVGSTLDVELVAYDVRGDVIPPSSTGPWVSRSPGLTAKGEALKGAVTGVYPSPPGATFDVAVDINGTTYGLGVTVTSFIEGVITQDPLPAPSPSGEATLAPAAGDATPAPAAVSAPAAGGVTVVLSATAGAEIARAVTDAGGRYRLAGLAARSYDVAPQPMVGLSPTPPTTTVVLGAATPKGTANFHMSRAPVDSIDATATPDELDALGATTTMAVLAFDSLGAPLAGRVPTFVSTDPSVATVSTGGLVTAVNNGQTWIRVTVESKLDSVLVTVDQKAVSIVLMDEEGAPLPDSARVLWGETHTLDWEAKDARGNLISHAYKQPTFMSSDATKVAVDTAGVVTASTSNVGRAEVSATMDGASDLVVAGVHGIRAIDLTLPGDLPTLADSLYGQILGSINVDWTALTDLDALLTIWDVQGDVNIRDNVSLMNLAGLSNIEEIGGTLRVKRNASLTTPTGYPAAKLKRVHGALKVWDNDNPGFTNGDLFANVVEVGQYIDVVGNDYLEDLSGLTSLKYARGLSLESNQSLDLDGGFPALEYLGWDGLWIDESATVVRLPMLKGVEGQVGVGGEVSPVNPIQELNLPSLQCVQGAVWIYDNEDLTTVRMPNLVSIGMDCITPFDECGDIGPAPSRSISRAGDPDPTDRGMEARRGATTARLRALDQQADDRREQRVAERAARRLQEAQALGAQRAPADARRLLDRARARALTVEAPQAIGCECGPGLMMENNDQLSTLQLGSLEEIYGPLYLYWMGDLQVVNLPSLRYVGEWVDVWEMWGLTAFLAPDLEEVGSFYLQVTSYFGDIDLSSLESTWEFEIEGPYGEDVGPMSAPMAVAEGVTPWTLDLPALETVGGEFHIDGAEGLTSLTLTAPGPLTVDGEFYLSDLPALVSVNLSSLASVGWGVHLQYLDDLSTASFPNLTSVGESVPYYYDSFFEVRWNDALQSIAAPNLEAFVDHLTLTGNDALQTFDLAGVFADDVEISSNGVLASLPDLSGLGESEGSANLFIGYNDQLLDLDGLAGVGSLARLQLYGNALLNDLTALETPDDELTWLGELQVVSNPALQSLTGLGHVESALTQVVIQGNLLLTDISGLSGIGAATSANPAVSGPFTVTGNPALSDCHVNTVMDAIAGAFSQTRATAFPGGWTVSNLPCGGQQED
ncbi:MAG: hypothetical protein AMXMBFR53_01490 [Gemmatimonadota bacterium]